jgi:hypothetical protein
MSELSPQARALLDATRDGDDPTARDRARLRRNLQIAIAAAAGGATAAAAAPAVATQAGVAGASAQLAAGAQAVVVTSVSAKVGVAVTVAVIGVASSSAVVTREPIVTSPAPRHAAAVAQPSRAKRTRPAKPSPQLAPLLQPAPVLTLALPEVELVPAPAPVHEPVSAPVRRSISRPAPPPLAPSLEGELELLSAAQAALRDRDDLSALALLDAHAARYPNGVLALERDAVRIVALCSSGRLDEGRALRAGNDSLASSPLASRIDKACKR